MRGLSKVRRWVNSLFCLPAPKQARQYEIGILLAPSSLLWVWGVCFVWILKPERANFGSYDAAGWKVLILFGLPTVFLMAVWWLALSRERYASLKDVPWLLRLGVWGFRGLAGAIALTMLVMMLIDGWSRDPAFLVVGLAPLFALVMVAGPSWWPSRWLEVCRRWIWWGLFVVALSIAAASVVWGKSGLLGAFAFVLGGCLLLGPLALLTIDLATLKLRTMELSSVNGAAKSSSTLPGASLGE